jgi:hypothetical protein
MAEQVFNTLDDIQLRKDQLKVRINEESDKIDDLWHDLFLPQQSSSKGEFIANLVSNSITAIDAFLLVRKLMKTYGWLMGRGRKRK